MTFARARRIALVAAAVTTLLTVAASGSSGSPQAPSSQDAAALSGKGPIEFWRSKDRTGVIGKLIAQFNADHPDETVTLHELPDGGDIQRQQIILNSQIKNPKMAVVRTDVVWTSEFAANGYLVALPADQFKTDGFLKPSVQAATYFNKLYGMPYTSDGGLLFYRKDLLDKYNLQPPTTWDEMKAACRKIKAGENNPELGCYAGQYQKYEGLTVTFAEAVNSSGGVIIGPDGKPNVDTPEAKKGLDFLVDSFKDGTIPKAAITYEQEEARQAFESGTLIFSRNWPYIYPLIGKSDGSSKIVGKFAVAPLPGLSGPGVSSLGGYSLGIAANADNKATAAEFIKFMTSAESQKATTLSSSNAPTLEALYTDPDITKQLPYTPILLKSIQTAVPRPRVVKYGDTTLAIQDAVYSALQGEVAPDAALSSLQSRLEALTK